MDKFPEAFSRFEQVVEVDKIESFRELLVQFRMWAGQKWHGTNRQLNALAVEPRKRGIPVVVEKRPLANRGRGVAHVSERVAVSWRHEVVTVRGSCQDRYRDLKTGRFVRKP
jgi:hypothetical protein